LPDGFSRLLRIERPLGRIFYDRWFERLNEQRPGQRDDNHRRALSGAYLIVARVWMMGAALLIFPALVLRMFFPEVFIVLMCISVIPIAMMCVRAVQGLRLFPHLSILWEAPADQP
jgi:hypothetical protein